MRHSNLSILSPFDFALRDAFHGLRIQGLSTFDFALSGTITAQYTSHTCRIVLSLLISTTLFGHANGRILLKQPSRPLASI